MSGGGKGGSTSTQQEIPAWAQHMATDNIGRAQLLASTPYQPWTGPDVAALNNWERQGFDMQNDMNSAFGFDQVLAPAQNLPDPVTMGGLTGYSSYPAMAQGVENLWDVNPVAHGRFLQSMGMTPQMTGGPPLSPLDGNAGANYNGNPGLPDMSLFLGRGGR